EARRTIDAKDRVLAAKEQADQRDASRYMDVDRDFQLRQLLNLHALSLRLNAFFRETLQAHIRESLRRHRQERTPPPLHLIRACLQRVAADHEIIQQAVLQRRWNRHGEGAYHVSEQALGLLLMDKLAIQAMGPFAHLLTKSKDEPLPLIVSYLSERTHMRRLPYAEDVILIGVSYDRVPPAEDIFADKPLLGVGFPAAELMAIPHEVGHHMYHHARLPETEQTFAQLSEQFRENPYFRWCEEIFADLYGCVVAGPLSALSMQALLTSGDRARVWKDDEEHPTPMVRVFILAEMLRALKKYEEESGKSAAGASLHYAFAEMVDQLDRDWAEILRLWGYERVGTGAGRPARIYLPDPATVQLDKLVNVERMLASVRPIIVEFVERLLSAARFTPPPAGTENALSLAIPWCRRDSRIPDDYHEEMAAIRQAVHKKAPIQSLIPDRVAAMAFREAHPDRRLQEILAAWGDSGPTGIGDHPG
ncbi:MAG: hypothetical protein D6790_10230, partial [Caldilineae bacterium]